MTNTQQIDYVDVRNGGLEFYSHVDGKSEFVGFAHTAEEAAKLFVKHGTGHMYGGSAMDFASEEGFDTDEGAQEMLDKAFELAHAEVNAAETVRFVNVFHSAFETEAKLVACVSVQDLGFGTVEQALEYAYRWTQNIHDSWSKNGEKDGNDRVETVDGEWWSKDGFSEDRMGYRSTSYRDHMMAGGKVYRVDMIGFTQVDKIKPASWE